LPRRSRHADWRYPDPEKLKCEDWERRKELGAMPAGLERQLRAFIALPFRSLEDISLRERPGFRIEIVDRVARQPKNLGHQRIKLLCWMHLGAEPFEILTAYAVHDRLGKDAPRSVAIG